MSGAARLVPIARAEVRVVDHPWVFAQQNAVAIEAHWLTRLAAQPRLFNGDVLLLENGRIEGGVLAGNCIRTDFKSLLYWRERAAEDRTVLDAFAAGAIHSREGWLLVARMADHTSSRGFFYPPCGMLGRNDIRDGTVDFEASMLREIAEETGLSLDRAAMKEPLLVFDDRRLAYMRPIRLGLPAAIIADKVHAFLHRQSDPELAEIRFVRGRNDIIEARMLPGTTAYIRHAFP